MDLVCPECTAQFHGEPGTYASCPNCSYQGGIVPGASDVPAFASYEPFLPSAVVEEEEEEDEVEEQGPPKENSGLALTSMILGLAVIIPFAGPVAVAFGIAGLIHVKKKPDELKGTGLAVIGIVFGLLASIVWVVAFTAFFSGIGRLIYGR